LLVALVGLTLLVVVGPRTSLDAVIHLLMILVVSLGLLVTLRDRPGLAPGRTG